MTKERKGFGSSAPSGSSTPQLGYRPRDFQRSRFLWGWASLGASPDPAPTRRGPIFDRPEEASSRRARGVNHGVWDEPTVPITKMFPEGSCNFRRALGRTDEIEAMFAQFCLPV